MRRVLFFPTAIALMLAAHTAMARDQMHIVGSSTLIPFTATVVDRLVKTIRLPVPAMEATGTGNGFVLFCKDFGPHTPDVTSSSRQIKAAEFDNCQQHGVRDILEIKIGFDAIALAHSKRRRSFNLTLAQLFQALAKEVEVGGVIAANPFKTWAEIDPSLPATKIAVYGPPINSGTHDHWVEQVMVAGCASFAAIQNLPQDRKSTVCKTMRDDGPYVVPRDPTIIDLPDFDTIPDAFAIVGYNYFNRNMETLTANPINGVQPSIQTIATGAYPVRRPLFIYAKAQHIGVIPNLKEFLTEYASDQALGPNGYLAAKGLLPLTDEERARVVRSTASLTPMVRPGE